MNREKDLQAYMRKALSADELRLVEWRGEGRQLTMRVEPIAGDAFEAPCPAPMPLGYVKRIALRREGAGIVGADFYLREWPEMGLHHVYERSMLEVMEMWARGAEPQRLREEVLQQRLRPMDEETILGGKVLPTGNGWGARDLLSAAGVRFGEVCEGDPEFVHADLPPGWGVQKAERDGCFYVCDARGLRRAHIIYCERDLPAMGVARWAGTYPKTRYGVYTQFFGGPTHEQLAEALRAAGSGAEVTGHGIEVRGEVDVAKVLADRGGAWPKTGVRVIVGDGLREALRTRDVYSNDDYRLVGAQALDWLRDQGLDEWWKYDRYWDLSVDEAMPLLEDSDRLNEWPVWKPGWPSDLHYQWVPAF